MIRGSKRAGEQNGGYLDGQGKGESEREREERKSQARREQGRIRMIDIR